MSNERNQSARLRAGFLARWIIAAILFFAVIQIILGPKLLQDIANSYSLIVSALVLRRFFRATMISVSREAVEQQDLLTVGIFLSWLGICLGTCLSIALQYFGVEIYSEGLVGIRYILAVTAGLLHLCSPDQLPFRPTRSGARQLLTGAVGGLIVSILLIVLRLHPFVH